jgi:hypothetical protein
LLLILVAELLVSRKEKFRTNTAWHLFLPLNKKAVNPFSMQFVKFRILIKV